MVNTFVISRGNDPSNYYSSSAELLDKVRLNKQITEASQIYDILFCLHKISQLLKWDLCPSAESVSDSPYKVAQKYLQRVKWFEETNKKYLTQNKCLVKNRGKYYFAPRDNLPLKLHSNKKYQIQGDKVIYQGKEYSREDVFLTKEGDRVYTLKGYSSHTIIKMWIGYEESLKMYINDHLYEFNNNRYTKTSRLCHHSYPPFTLNQPENIIHPWWLRLTDLVIISHQVNLYRKEIYRQEKEWYIHIFDYQDSYFEEWVKKYGYLWTGSLTEDEIVKIITKKLIDLSKICASINSDNIIQRSYSYKYLYYYKNELYCTSREN